LRRWFVRSHRVDPRNTYYRVIAVVPLSAGSGTPDDPKRPKYAPWPPSRSQTGIIAYSQQLSDDGKLALVEFVARDRAAFQAIFNDKTIRFFEKGKSKRQDIETELKKYKRTSIPIGSGRWCHESELPRRRPPPILPPNLRAQCRFSCSCPRPGPRRPLSAASWISPVAASSMGGPGIAPTLRRRFPWICFTTDLP
jgi:hypothetical protein